VASVSKDGEPTWLITDFSGTTLTTSKTAGATSSAKFDPFGNITSGSMSQPLQFHGQYKDSVLGLYDMRQRDYNPVTGMFLSTDPIAVAVGDPFISRYSYGFNNPLVFADASGLEPRAWKDGRIVGVPGVASVSAAVAKAASVAAASHSQARNPNAHHGGPPRRPSVLPSVVVNCEPEEATGGGFFDSIGSGLSSAWHSTTSAVSTAWNSTTSAATSAWNDTTEWWNDSVVPWWKEHGDEVLLVAGIAPSVACIVVSFGTCAIAVVGVAAVTIADGMALRGMTGNEALATAALAVVPLGLGRTVSVAANASRLANGVTTATVRGEILAENLASFTAFDAPAIAIGVGTRNR
jgi:RHS repeat-associated protein